MAVTIMFNMRNVTVEYLLTNETIGSDTDKYQIIIDRIQFSMTVIGFLGNITVYVTLLKNGNMFTSPTIVRLLKNQSIIDSIVCLFGGILVMQPAMWTTPNEGLSGFFCMASFIFVIIIALNLISILVCSKEPDVFAHFETCMK